MSVGSVPERGKHRAVGRTKTLTVDMCGQKDSLCVPNYCVVAFPCDVVFTLSSAAVEDKQPVGPGYRRTVTNTTCFSMVWSEKGLLSRSSDANIHYMAPAG